MHNYSFDCSFKLGSAVLMIISVHFYIDRWKDKRTDGRVCCRWSITPAHLLNCGYAVGSICYKIAWLCPIIFTIFKRNPRIILTSQKHIWTNIHSYTFCELVQFISCLKYGGSLVVNTYITLIINTITVYVKNLVQLKWLNHTKAITSSTCISESAFGVFNTEQIWEISII